MNEQPDRIDQKPVFPPPIISKWVLYYGNIGANSHTDPGLFPRLILTEEKDFEDVIAGPDIHGIWSVHYDPRCEEEDYLNGGEAYLSKKSPPVNFNEPKVFTIDLSSELATQLALEPPSEEWMPTKFVFSGLPAMMKYHPDEAEIFRELIRLNNNGIIRLRKIDWVVSEFDVVVSLPGITMEDEWRAIAHTSLPVVTDEVKLGYRNLIEAIDRGRLAKCSKNEETKWLSVSEAARQLGVSEGTVSKWCDSGKLKDNNQTRKNRRVELACVLTMVRNRGIRPRNTETEAQVEEKMSKGKKRLAARKNGSNVNGCI